MDSVLANFTKPDFQQAIWKLMERDHFKLESISYREYNTKKSSVARIRFWKNAQELAPFGEVEMEGLVEWRYAWKSGQQDVVSAFLFVDIDTKTFIWQASYIEGVWTKWIFSKE